MEGFTDCSMLSGIIGIIRPIVLDSISVNIPVFVLHTISTRHIAVARAR